MKRVAQGSYENISYKVFRDAENNEYVTKYYIDDKKYDDGDYFTSDKQDAIDTGESGIRFMYERMNKGEIMPEWTTFDNGKFASLYKDEKFEVILTTYDYTKPTNLYISPDLVVKINAKDGKRKVVWDATKIDWWLEELLPFSMTSYKEIFMAEKAKYYARRGWMWQNGVGEKIYQRRLQDASKTDEV